MTRQWRGYLLAILLCLWPLGGGVSIVHADLSSPEVVPAKCSVLQDVIDELVADFLDPKRRTDKVPRRVLDRLDRSEISIIEKLFKCFDYEELSVLENEKRFVSRKIMTEIVVGKSKIPTTREQREFVYLPVRARLTVWQMLDGTLESWGEYLVG